MSSIYECIDINNYIGKLNSPKPLLNMDLRLRVIMMFLFY